MKKWQKVLSSLLSGILLLSVFNLGAYAESTFEEIYLSDLDWSEVQVNSEDAWAQPKKDVNCVDSPIRMIDAAGNAAS